MLEHVEFERNSDDFVFDQEIIVQIVERAYRIAEVPVPVRYFSEASSVGLGGSVLYGTKIIALLCRFLWQGRRAGNQVE